MSKLLNALKIETNGTLTENGAVTHTSTLSDVLDFYYHAPARRGKDNTGLFRLAFAEDRTLALRALCYVRDVRGGQGERETFRQGLRELNRNFPEAFLSILPHVSEYGRWDDILEFVSNPAVVDMVSKQLEKDLYAMMKGESVSLLAKWMPSANTSSKATKTLAHKWIKALGTGNEKNYRQMLSKLRAAIQIVETAMSSKSWKAINYSRVPSKASLRYRTAFHKQDGARYAAFIEAALKGEAKINSGTLYPYELTGKYLDFEGRSHTIDNTVEALWKQLPNYADTEKNALVVCDVSGSMFGSGKPSPICVATSLAIYIAERNKGLFKDHFLTFSSDPQLNKLKGETLYEKVSNLCKAKWGMSTDLQKAFALILKTAVDHSVPAEEMPEVVFIVSDMEFNECGEHTNLEALKVKYAQAGYVIPKVVFWNVASRNKQTPVTQDERGTYLVSGCSPAIFTKAINTKACTPMQLMLEVLNGPRYERVTA